jgi:hypothetical protein
MNDEKKKVLFLTHLYPKFENDFMAPFLATLIEGLASKYHMIVLSPRHKDADSERNNVTLEYFAYFFRSMEKLSYTGDLYEKIKGFNIHYKILTVFFMISFLIKGIRLVIKYRPDILHCSWFIPAGAIGALLSKCFNIPLVITVHSDSFLIEKSKILKFLAKIIFSNTNTVIPVSNAVKEYVSPLCKNARVIYSCNRVF